MLMRKESHFLATPLKTVWISARVAHATVQRSSSDSGRHQEHVGIIVGIASL
jgi:hypothetical protein